MVMVQLQHSHEWALCLLQIQNKVGNIHAKQHVNRCMHAWWGYNLESQHVKSHALLKLFGLKFWSTFMNHTEITLNFILLLNLLLIDDIKLKGDRKVRPFSMFEPTEVPTTSLRKNQSSDDLVRDAQVRWKHAFSSVAKKWYPHFPTCGFCIVVPILLNTHWMSF